MWRAEGGVVVFQGSSVRGCLLVFYALRPHGINAKGKFKLINLISQEYSWVYLSSGHRAVALPNLIFGYRANKGESLVPAFNSSNCSVFCYVPDFHLGDAFDSSTAVLHSGSVTSRNSASRLACDFDTANGHGFGLRETGANTSMFSVREHHRAALPSEKAGRTRSSGGDHRLMIIYLSLAASLLVIITALLRHTLLDSHIGTFGFLSLLRSPSARCNQCDDGFWDRQLKDISDLA
ncbi:hypothetical protein EVAR_31847_1 [Eumeta japonica]|uniref:Uncharacterized protein n=1 Tax=Eumeta variegata TaxID=151549 RepID=A0A4C1WKV9_EUMVA|nr:hypothetical protein EVAR_31847_1 [Eumeta japonica]